MCSVLHFSSDFASHAGEQYRLGKCGKERSGMSYSICRIAKIKASGVTGIQIHDRREKDGVSHTNKDIDWTKTKENIDLLVQRERYRTVVSNRITELKLKKAIRSDATVICQCLITSDIAFFEKMSRDEQIEYFKKSLGFIKKRYGEKNLVSATIHYDEQTPHMHVNFVPVTEDGRLSARDLFSPKQLRNLQDDYNRFVRENGYDLERGQIDSKTKHLEVEEYKVATRYDQLKEKKAEIERLEQIDKTVDLKAEKGRIAYSTKEVDAIKEQNKALKINNNNKDREIKQLENSLAKLNRQLKQVQNEVEGTPLNRLKDLENENRALQEYRKANPSIDKDMERYDQMRKQAYTLGNNMAKCRENYHACLEERERLINHSNACDKMVKDCVSKAKDLTELQKEITYSLTQENALQAELEGLKGIFKKKQRDDFQKRLEQQEKESQRLIDRLSTEHNTTLEHIPLKLREYTDQEENFIKEKAEAIVSTNKIEKIRDKSIYSYKYQKALFDCQNQNFKEISERLIAREKLRPGEEKVFRTTREDRTQILKDMVKNQPQNIIDKCKEIWIKQDRTDQHEMEIFFSNNRIQSKEWDNER